MCFLSMFLLLKAFLVLFHVVFSKLMVYFVVEVFVKSSSVGVLLVSVF